MFRYSPYWVKPIVQDPLPTAFGGALIWLDYGYFRPDETNKLAFIEPNELGIDHRVMIKGIDSNVNLGGSASYPAKIIHDYVNDNILVMGVNGLSSFDPRLLTLNWNVPLTAGQFTFCGNTLTSSAISESYVWVYSSSELRAYNLLTGSLVYNFTISGTHDVVGGTVQVFLPISLGMPVADDMFFAGWGYLDAHNGGAVQPYQGYRLTPTSATTFIVEAVPGLPGTPTMSPGAMQTFPLPGFKYEIFVFLNASVNGLDAVGKLNLQTGTWTTLITSGPSERWGLNYLQLDCIDVTANKVWISGTRTDSNGTRQGLYEFTYPGFELLGAYGGRIQQSLQFGVDTNPTLISTGTTYSFYVVGSYIYGIDATGSATSLYLWDVGDYSLEPTKVLPSVEGTLIQTYFTVQAGQTYTYQYPEEYIHPKNIYFPKIPPLKTFASSTYSNVLALRPTSKIITQSLPGLNVPSIVGTLNAANPIMTINMWQKITWVRVELDGINTAEIQIVNDGNNETTVGWLYDDTGRQVTYNKELPLLLGDMVNPGTYYLALVNVKNDTTSLIAASNHNFRITINNAPTVTPHELTVRLVRSMK